jgi:hypothetical protein
MKTSHFTRLLQTSFLPGALALLFFTSSCATTTTVKIHPSSSESHVRGKILKYTPVGSSYEQVTDFVHSRLETLGPPHYRNAPASRPIGRRGEYESVGVHYIIVLVAEGSVGHEGTFVTWAFDENDKLIDVIVDKGRD